MIKVNNVNKSFGDHHVLKDVSFNIEEKSMVAIMGPSGCGKSTLLNILGLIEEPDTGTLSIVNQSNVRINSRKAMLMRRNVIGYVFQDFALCQNDTVEFNLMLAMKYKKISRKEKFKEIEQVLNEIGLSDVRNQKVCTLSGGEQQRVALARVLLKPCEIVLADEPTGNLDYNNSVIAFDLFEKIRNHGKTVVIVTHDFELGKRCDYIIDLPKSRSDVYDL